jgi:hypothetical protein
MKAAVELVYFRGCPHVEAAREALQAALMAMGFAPEWEEWDQESPETPARVQGYGSPTVLVGGRDVRGGSPGSAGRACRVDGLPSSAEIRSALAAEAAQ